MERECVACGRVFAAQRSTARFCGGVCRARSARAGAAVVRRVLSPSAVQVTANRVEPSVTDRALIAAVWERVTVSGLETSPDGLLAVALAERMAVEPSGSAYASLHRQLVAGLDRIEGLRPQRSGLDELRLRRDRKRAG